MKLFLCCLAGETLTYAVGAKPLKKQRKNKKPAALSLPLGFIKV